MRVSVRIAGLGRQLGLAARRLSDAARLQPARRARSAPNRDHEIQRHEVSHGVSQSGPAGGDLRNSEH